jgi:phosphate:Na+ symporter
MGGSALLVYSIEELSKAIQYLAGSRVRVWINTFADNRFSAIVLGLVLSLLLSSSSAVTVMLVGLANAQLLTLEQVFSVTLGASVGTTFIVQLFAFPILEYGMVFVAAGVFISVFSKTDRVFHVARTLLFLGLMFFSMRLLVDSGKVLQQDPFFKFLVNYFKDRPIVSLLISASMTALIHSSAATIAFVMSLMMAQNGTLREAIPWVIGANLGTTTTAYFASLKSGTLGKQAALANLLCKVGGMILIYPLLEYLEKAAVYLAGADLSRQIAHTHTLFNLFIAAVFFPFVPWGVKFIRRISVDHDGDGPFHFEYLDPRSLNTPELALAQAQREILRLADTVEQMVERCILLFSRGNQKEVEALKADDQVVDFLNRGVKLYLTKLSQNEMAPEQVHKEFELLLRTNDLENIGDIVDKNILELVRKNIKKGYSFSREGWREITDFHAKVVDCLRLSTAYFNSRDRTLYTKLMVSHEQIEDMMLDLSEAHVQRLHKGVKESLDTTSVHLDLLGNLKRIADLSVNFTKIYGLKAENE